MHSGVTHAFVFFSLWNYTLKAIHKTYEIYIWWMNIYVEYNHVFITSQVNVYIQYIFLIQQFTSPWLGIVMKMIILNYITNLCPT